MKLIKVALEFRSFRVLRYLHHIALLFQTYEQRKQLVIQLSLDLVEMIIRWIINSLDETNLVPTVLDCPIY